MFNPNSRMRKVYNSPHFTEEFEVYNETKAQNKVKIFTVAFKKLPACSLSCLCILCCGDTTFNCSSSPRNVLFYAFVSLLGLLPLPPLPKTFPDLSHVPTLPTTSSPGPTLHYIVFSAHLWLLPGGRASPCVPSSHNSVVSSELSTSLIGSFHLFSL